MGDDEDSVQVLWEKYPGRDDNWKVTEVVRRQQLGLPREGVDDQPRPAIQILDSAYPFVPINREGRDSDMNTAVKLRLAGTQENKIGVLDDHTIDFIFFSRGDWGVMERLSIPTFKEVNEETGGRSWNAEDRNNCPKCDADVQAVEADGACSICNKNTAQMYHCGHCDEVVCDSCSDEPYQKAQHKEMTGELLPNWRYPLDHFMIGATLVMAA